MTENKNNEKPKFKKRSITKRKREEFLRLNKFGAFDFETTALDGHVVFGTLQAELSINGERTEVFNTYSAAGMLDLLIENNAPKMRWYAHNLEYDLLFLLEEGRHRLDRGELLKIELCERGMGKFYRAIFHLPNGGRVDMFDSMAIFGFSLKEFLKLFSTVGGKLELDFDAETFDINNQYHIDYARQDTRGLLDAVINFDLAIYQIFGVHVKGTISSTALAAWEVTLSPDDKFYRVTKKQEEFFRKAYFGGLTFLTDNTEKTDCVSLDVNSMYPHCMRAFGVPVGKVDYTRLYKPGRPGVYRAIFTAPGNLDFGCIGYRDNKGIAWPRGEFESCAFDFEIERAFNWGYKIKIIEGLLFEGYAFPFSAFVDLCEKMRAEYKGTAFEIVVKLIQNSVYGKFGTKDEGSECVIFSDDAEIGPEWYPYIDPESGAMVLENVYKRDTERDAYYMLPHWAAHITARARAELLNIVEVAEGAVIYGDTDSAKMPRADYERLLKAGLIDCGAGYGQLKLDAEYQKFRAIAPKVYAYTEKGKFSGKGKGIPEKYRNAEFWQAVYQGETPTVHYKTLTSLQSAIKKGGERKLNDAKRTSTKLDNSSGWLDNNGRVRAVTIKDKKRCK